MLSVSIRGSSFDGAQVRFCGAVCALSCPLYFHALLYETHTYSDTLYADGAENAVLAVLCDIFTSTASRTPPSVFLRKLVNPLGPDRRKTDEFARVNSTAHSTETSLKNGGTAHTSPVTCTPNVLLSSRMRTAPTRGLRRFPPCFFSASVSSR